MTEARITREAVVAGVGPEDDVEARLAREGVIAAHLNPGSQIEGQVASIRLVVAVSRGLHGWDIIQRDRGTP